MSSYGWGGRSVKELKKDFGIVSRDLKSLRKTLEFDCLAFCGSSGAICAFPMMLSMNIPVIYVRKLKEQSHGDRIEMPSKIGIAKIRKYLIVDDFMSTGNTIKHIYNSILKHYPRSDITLECVGMYAWAANDRRHGNNVRLSVDKTCRGHRKEIKEFQLFYRSVS